MDVVYIDILRKPLRSRARQVIGVITFLIAFAWILLRIFIGPPVRLFDILYSLFFGIYGIAYILDGSGISVAHWFGEAFIDISPEKIYIKGSIRSKKWLLYWDDIEEVAFRVINIKFQLKDGSFRELNYDHLEWEQIQEIKGTVKELSVEKGIRIITPD